jgi:hypothetical protein
MKNRDPGQDPSGAGGRDDGGRGAARGRLARLPEGRQPRGGDDPNTTLTQDREAVNRALPVS